MFKSKIFFLLIALGYFCAACGNSGTQNSMSTSTAPPKIKTGVQPQPDAEIAVIETADYGTIKLELYSNIAPQMVARFKELANAGFYNNTKIHRIDPNLGIIQGGDPNSKNDDPADDGMGNSGKPNVPGEFSDVPFDTGIVGAARSGGNFNSANSQFFIMTKRQKAFETASNPYTVFGKVIEGQSAVNLIANAPPAAGSRDKPDQPIIIRSISITKR